MNRRQWALLAIGVVLWLIGTRLGHTDAQFLRAWLAAYLFALDLSLGALALLMVHALTGGDWGRPLRAPLLAATRLLPLYAVMFLALLPALARLYPWWPALQAEEPSDAFKATWLESRFFMGRAVAYFLVWLLLAWGIRRLLRRPAGGGSALRKLSAAGLVLYAVTVTLAGIDWIGSLLPRWYSSGFGLVWMTAQALGALAFGLVISTRVTREAAAPSPQTWIDLGNLLLTCAMLWMYVAFTQFLIIWAEDLPAEIAWYLPRLQTDWRWLTIAVSALQFGLPFILLLSRDIKRAPARLGALAAVMLAGHALFAFYLVTPTLAPRGFELGWVDVVAYAAICSVAAALWQHFHAGERHA
jgi:hypothetical protein